jgi:hypothetical protein
MWCVTVCVRACDEQIKQDTINPHTTHVHNNNNTAVVVTSRVVIQQWWCACAARRPAPSPRAAVTGPCYTYTPPCETFTRDTLWNISKKRNNNNTKRTIAPVVSALDSKNPMQNSHKKEREKYSLPLSGQTHLWAVCVARRTTNLRRT